MLKGRGRGKNPLGIMGLVGLSWWLSGKEPTSHTALGVQFLGREYLLEKEVATHSSILAWKIPWMDELGGLQAMES